MAGVEQNEQSEVERGRGPPTSIDHCECKCHHASRRYFRASVPLQVYQSRPQHIGRAGRQELDAVPIHSHPAIHLKAHTLRFRSMKPIPPFLKFDVVIVTLSLLLSSTVFVSRSPKRDVFFEFLRSSWPIAGQATTSPSMCAHLFKTLLTVRCFSSSVAAMLKTLPNLGLSTAPASISISAQSR